METFEGSQDKLTDFLADFVDIDYGCFYGFSTFSLQELVILREHVNQAILEEICKKHGSGITEIIKGNI